VKAAEWAGWIALGITAGVLLLVLGIGILIGVAIS
jgi:hypothetical protein